MTFLDSIYANVQPGTEVFLPFTMLKNMFRKRLKDTLAELNDDEITKSVISYSERIGFSAVLEKKDNQIGIIIKKK